MLLLLSLLICFVSSQPGPGIQVPFAWQDYLLIVNRERQAYNIPLIDYDEDVAKIAAFTCSQCAWTDVRPAAERQKMLCDLKGLPLGDINVDRYQTVGENRAASAGVNATPSPAGWINPQDWTCADNSCKSGATCGEYTQVIWNNTLYMGCGQCHCNINSPEPLEGTDWTFLVCNFVEAGNFAGKHPLGEGAIKDAACAKTYTPLPPPQPPACDTRKCTDPASCPSPLTAATCNATSGAWEIKSAKAADFAPTVYLGCGLTVETFTANAGDKLRVNVCGKISVTGTTTFNGNPTVDLEFQDIAGLKPGKYQPFFETATPISGGGVFGGATAQSVWSPSELLCAAAITGSETSYVLLHDCLDKAVTPVSPLPDGGSTVANGQSPSSEVVRSSVAGSGGDMNDPDLQTLPKKNLDGTLAPAAPSPLVPEAPTTPSNGSGGNTLPGWAIFLIVLACLIVIVVIIVIIVLLTSSSGAESF